MLIFACHAIIRLLIRLHVVDHHPLNDMPLYWLYAMPYAAGTRD